MLETETEFQMAECQ